MRRQIDHIRPPQYPLLGNKRICRAARTAVLSRIQNIGEGELVLKDPWSQTSLGKQTDRFPVKACITVLDPRFYLAILLRGSIGAGEAFMAGWWIADDLVTVIRILVNNLLALNKMERGFSRVSEPVFQTFHRLRKNTLKGGGRNIHAHYDLSNAFYALFLDSTMTYSCAVFESRTDRLETAQTNKYKRICNKLGIRPDHHLLEIGTGWGGFAIYAAKTIGCRVTTTTISRQQFKYAREKIRENGLENKVSLLFEDYRELTGKYDRIVSIEMIEAVGHHYLEHFFKACGNLLKEDGLLGLQAITIPDQFYLQHIRTVDFIRRYIFPGSFIPSVTAMCRAATRASDLRLVHLEDITAHYAKTLALWRENFLANRPKVLEMGFSDEFARMWEFYLCYCQGSFAQRYNGDAQMVFSKARKPDPVLPEAFVPHPGAF